MLLAGTITPKKVIISSSSSSANPNAPPKMEGFFLRIRLANLCGNGGIYLKTQQDFFGEDSGFQKKTLPKKSKKTTKKMSKKTPKIVLIEEIPNNHLTCMKPLQIMLCLPYDHICNMYVSSSSCFFASSSFFSLAARRRLGSFHSFWHLATNGPGEKWWHCWWFRNPVHNHLGCIKPCQKWDTYHINWCRISCDRCSRSFVFKTKRRRVSPCIWYTLEHERMSPEKGTMLKGKDRLATSNHHISGEYTSEHYFCTCMMIQDTNYHWTIRPLCRLPTYSGQLLEVLKRYY